jgi:tRNA pseudouridine38-40 synthase
MPRYAFLVEYDGAPFAGWQRQSGPPTVQAALESALAALGDPAPHVQGAGRTDAGVHATGQVAHADLARDWDPWKLAEALNARLRPAPVAILKAARTAPDFHARFSATGRRYLYRILVRRAPPALDAGRVWHIRHPLDPALMADGARRLTGRHDFTTFRSVQCQSDSPVKTLDRFDIDTAPVPGGTEIRLSLAARSFLHNQVRSMAGTLERVGAGSWTPGDVTAALLARDRAACGPVAPPQGLCLTAVSYPEDPFA